MKRVVKKKKKGTTKPAALEIEEPDPNQPVVHGLREIRIAQAQQRHEEEELVKIA